MPALAPDGRPDLERIAHAFRRKSPGERRMFLASLDDEDLSIVTEALSRGDIEGWRATPDAMAAHLLKARFQRYAYIRLLGEKFRQLVTGEDPRQIWNLPARYGKSTVGSQWGPAWLLDLRAWTTSMLISYGDDLANENAVKVRDILNEYPEEIRTRLRLDRRRMDRFVTDEGGGILAAGINSSITGFGVSEGGVLVLDDPFKNWTEAHQPLIRQKAWNNYRSVLRIRLDSDDCGILVIQTRWHEEDITGMLLKESEDQTGDKFTLVRLPALAEAADPKSSNPALRLPDPLGREPGEPLCPERFPLVSVQARSRALGSYLCSPAETPIVMADWTVKPISEVRVGDSVLGFVNEPGRKRRWEPSVVRQVTSKPGVVANYAMASGRTVRATRDHRWSIRAGRPYQVAKVGTPLVHAVEVDYEPLDEDLGRWQYLAGLIDGEGSVSPYRNLNLTQTLGRNAPVAARMKETLDALGIRYHETIRPRANERSQDKLNLDISTVGRVYRTLLRHTHLAKRDQVIACLYGGAGGNERIKDRVVSIGGDVEETVYALGTSTGNYVAWGYLSANSAGLEQQRPAPEEGGEIKRAWFKIEQTIPENFDEWLSSWDMKLKDKATGSYVVGTVWGRSGSGKWLLDVFRGQWSQAMTTNAIALAQVRWPFVGTHLIENTGNGPEVIAELRDAKPTYVVSDEMAADLGMTIEERAAVQRIRRHGIAGLIPVTVKGKKVVRMRGVSGTIEAGDVHLPERAPWLGAYLDEIASFPNEPNDQADSTSQALARLDRGAATFKAATAGAPVVPMRIAPRRRRYS